MDRVPLDELRPIRLPVGFEAFDLHGALAIFSIAVLAGLGLALLVRWMSEPRPTLKRIIARHLAEARPLPADERLLRQARAIEMLDEAIGTKRRVSKTRREAIGGALAALRTDIGAAIYRPAPDIDCDRLDRDILGLAARAGS
ncbi:hypothetical protein U0C82_13060 [Fulvimarina sp. 2208YS6-2-32]|uniref:Uncharacterized protein n=1 Tax=Fulvimarina uroteuthidis TaxID=3098149 RepID=A0ABU5I3W1_9HYPH|nr:hypothetical protein [Fulvimarina sp. 2208YS6-2-32]MDY8110070.1 hypothetical protein [Fulvimarina sp. 2208YS6-2-32]